MEAQRKHYRGDLYRALRKAAIVEPVRLNRWVRICTYRYSQQPLNAFGSTIGAGGRFNFGDALDSVDAVQFPALYIGENKTVAYREYFGMEPRDSSLLTAQEFALTPVKAISVLPMNGTLHNILDITHSDRLRDFVKILSSFTVSDDVNALAAKAGIEPRSLVNSVKIFMTSIYEQNWRGWARQHGLPANCQLFGKLAWEAQYDGILYRSVKGGGRCVAVFPQNLQHSDTRIWMPDSAPSNVTTMLDASNWQVSCSP